MIGNSFRENLFGLLAAKSGDGSSVSDSSQTEDEINEDTTFDYTHSLGIPDTESAAFECRKIGNVKEMSPLKSFSENVERYVTYSVCDRVDLSTGAFQLLFSA